MKCIFCKESESFNTVEHIIPESLGNDDLLIHGHVCDVCQNYFGKEIENFVLNKTPFAFWRIIYGIKSKKGRYPIIDLTLPERQKGRIQNTHPDSEKNIQFEYDEELGASLIINDDKITREILSEKKQTLDML